MILQFEDVVGEEICIVVNDNLNACYTDDYQIRFVIGNETISVTYATKEGARKAFDGALALIGSKHIVLGVASK